MKSKYTFPNVVTNTNLGEYLQRMKLQCYLFDLYWNAWVSEKHRRH